MILCTLRLEALKITLDCQSFKARRNTTNCRSGPGTNYGILDVVPAGQPVEVLGKDNSGAYYVVLSPNGQTCWLWSHYASVNGNTDALVQMTPPAPQKDVYTSDWIEPVTIQVSDEFSWGGIGSWDGLMEDHSKI